MKRLTDSTFPFPPSNPGDGPSVSRAVSTLANKQHFAFVAPERRETPLTVQTIHAISDVGRTLHVHFLRDGLNAEVREILAGVRWAANRSAWSDYGRRKSQHVENYAQLSPRMLREARELEAEFGPESA